MAANLAEISSIIIVINFMGHFLCPNGRRNVFAWTIGRPLKNTAHEPLWAGGQQFEKRVFFSPFFWCFFVVFLRKKLFLFFTMTSNAFSRTIKRFLKGSQDGVTQQLNQTTTQNRKKTLCC